MKTLTLRIYVTVVAVLLLFALGSALIFQRHIDTERGFADQVLIDRMEAWGELIQRSLPSSQSLPADQATALREWARRLRIQLALDDEKGQRIGASDAFERRLRSGRVVSFQVKFDDGRVLWILRPAARQSAAAAAAAGEASAASTTLPRTNPRPAESWTNWWGASDASPWQRGVELTVVLMLLLIAVAAGTWPVITALTRRLNVLKEGAQRFGSGELSHRVEIGGRDEVAAVAASFNEAAARIEKLVRSHQSLLANASHELRSPLARMKMAMSLWEEVPEAQRDGLKREMHSNIAELDELVEEVLLASRIDILEKPPSELVDLQALAAEELSRMSDLSTSLHAEQGTVNVVADERLLRRALRNLLENARRYGGGQIDVRLTVQGDQALVWVCDRGDGVPADQRERIFEPFYRLPGHAERAGGVGLGLSLVKQIAAHHHGKVRCEAREGGGSCFVFSMPRVLS